MTQRCFVGLGSNLGSHVGGAEETVTAAIEALRELPQSTLVKASSLYRTAPVGLRNQPDFINAVVELSTTIPGWAMLHVLFGIEERFGRKRTIRNAPRTLDLDLLLYGDAAADGAELVLPHPRLHERAFVLAPLAEIAPEVVVPCHGPVSELLKNVLAKGDQHVERIAAK